MAIRDVRAWARWLIYMIGKIPAKFLAPIAVLFVDRVTHPIWGIDDAKTPVSYWEAANIFGNAAHNFGNRDQVVYHSWTVPDTDPTLEKLDGLQRRFRSSEDGKYVSYRITWGAPRDKGKKELYIGWTMNETPKMRPTLQLRAW